MRVVAGWVLIVMIDGSAVAGPNAAEQVAGPAPRRRVRRQYDAVIQLHEPAAPSRAPSPAFVTPSSTEEPMIDVRSRPDAILHESARSTFVPPPTVIHLKKDDEKKDDLWITMPAGTLLGVTMTATNTSVFGSWGWLADEVQKGLRQQRIDQDRKTAEKAAEDEMSEQALLMKTGVLIEPPTDAMTSPSLPIATNAPAIRLEARILNLEARASTAVGGPAIVADQKDPLGRPNVVTAPAPASADGPVGVGSLGAPSDLPGVRREVETIGQSHRGLAPAAVVSTEWRTSIERPLDRAAPMLPSLDEAIRSPLVQPPSAATSTGSRVPEMYGQRGSIFSPGFQTTSLELPGARTPAWQSPAAMLNHGSVSPTSGAAAPAPEPDTPSQPLVPSTRDIMRPFDPAGRPLTDWDRRR